MITGSINYQGAVIILSFASRQEFDAIDVYGMGQYGSLYGSAFGPGQCCVSYEQNHMGYLSSATSIAQK